MARVLVTGGTGFLGKALLPQLQGHDIFALRRSPSGEENGISWIQADLGEPVNTAALPGKIDAVIHLAQSPEYRNLPDGAPHVFRVNTAATAELLEYVRHAGAEQFLYASTGSIYEPFKGSMLETEPVAPKNFYPASKLAGERDEQASTDKPIALRGTEGLVINYARCCYPLPGDHVIGHLSAGRGIVVHRDTCKNI